MILTIDTAKLIWQSETAKSFYCTTCGTWIRTQYEGSGKGYPRECNGHFGIHTIEIIEEPENG